MNATARGVVIVAAVLVTLPRGAGAQVGHVPALSPYRDVNNTSRITLFGGYYIGASDEAGVLPRSGPRVGARWDVFIGGPADVAFRLSGVSTDRNVIDPTRAQGQRVVETRDVTLLFADVALAFNLTGRKSWRGLVPIATGSVGIVSDFGKRDVGGFRHGSTFALGYGFGMRYVPAESRISYRADIGSYLYSIEYPTSYYAVGGDGTSVLTSAVQRASWRNNWTLSAGITWQLFR